MGCTSPLVAKCSSSCDDRWPSCFATSRESRLCRPFNLRTYLCWKWEMATEEKAPFLPTDEPNTPSWRERPRKASSLFRIHTPLIVVEVVLLALNIGLLCWNRYPSLHGDSNAVTGNADFEAPFCQSRCIQTLSSSFSLTTFMQPLPLRQSHTKSRRSTSTSPAPSLDNQAMKWM